MTTDFRALCAELVESVEVLLEMRSPNAGRMWTTERRLRVARAALANEPAVPKSREPVAVTGQPSDEDLLGIACQSIEPYDKIRPGEYEAENNCAIEVYGSELVTFARAVLARWGNPAPQPPAEGEVAELVRMLTGIAHWRRRGRPGEGDPSPFDIRQADRLDRAAELLQRLSPPQPVAVSKRPPEDQLCWWFEPDEEDDEAYGSSWTLLRICGGTSSYTHWLPAHALPLPEVSE